MLGTQFTMARSCKAPPAPLLFLFLSRAVSLSASSSSKGRAADRAFLGRYNDGTQMRYKRERPKVVQHPVNGDIIAIANGIGVEILDSFAPGNDSACSLVLATPPVVK